MFQSISHTFGLMKTSWRVLMQDRELMLFPVLSGIVVIAVAGFFAALGYSLGTFDRVAASSNEASTAATVNGADMALFVVLSFVVTAVAVFFNAALISAAL